MRLIINRKERIWDVMDLGSCTKLNPNVNPLKSIDLCQLHDLRPEPYYLLNTSSMTIESEDFSFQNAGLYMH